MSHITYDPRAFARHSQRVAVETARARLTRHHAALRLADFRLAVAAAIVFGAALGFAF